MQITHEAARTAAADWLKGEAAALPHLAPTIREALDSPKSMDTLAGIIRDVAAKHR
tara:strand:- start:2003 stop:2170 length:168 start_codon:yes stop_codon:yes gene_type:complete